MRSVNVGPHSFVWVFWSRVNIYGGVRHFARNILSCFFFFLLFSPPQLFFFSSCTKNVTTILVAFLLPQSFPKSFPDPLAKKRIFTLLPTPTSKALPHYRTHIGEMKALLEQGTASSDRL